MMRVLILLALCNGAHAELLPLGRWPQGALPLSVLTLPQADHHRQAIQQAIDWWNIRLGHRVFLDVDDLRDGGLVVITELDPGPQSGWTKLFPMNGTDAKDDTIESALVWVLADPPFPDRTFAHELGHVLGLPHRCVKKHYNPFESYLPICAADNPTNSVMYPELVTGDYVLTDEDKQLLERYLPW